MTSAEQMAWLTSQLFSYYRFSFPVIYAIYLPLFFVSGFEKCFGAGVIRCLHCGFEADCRIAPETVDTNHYIVSAACRLRRLTGTLFDDLIVELQTELQAARMTCQFLFEEELLRVLSKFPDFRQSTFAFGQWSFKSNHAVNMLAEQGFYYSMKKQRIRCIACLATIENANAISSISAWHKYTSPRCSFVIAAETSQPNPFLYKHDMTGAITTDEIEAIGVESEALTHPKSATFPVCNMATIIEPSTRSLKRVRKEPTYKPSASLLTLFRALGTAGLNDSQIRQAIVRDPSLIMCRQATSFLDQLQKNTVTPSKADYATETDLRSGQMAIANNTKCPLCLSPDKDGKFEPCGHLYACFGCAQRILHDDNPGQRRCCVCRTPLTSVNQVLLTYEITHY